MLTDLEGHKDHYGGEIPSQSLKSNCNLRPDILLISPDAKVYPAELTSPMEGRMEEWNKIKTKKYTDDLMPQNFGVGENVWRECLERMHELSEKCE